MTVSPVAVTVASSRVIAPDFEKLFAPHVAGLFEPYHKIAEDPS